MGWKKLPYWARGLVVGVLVGAILVAFHYIEYLKCAENPVAYGDALRCLGPELGLGIAIWTGLGISLLGLIVGWIIGKTRKE